MQKKGHTAAYVVLCTIAVAGVIAFPLIIPVVGAAAKIIDPRPRKALYEANRAFKRLEKSGKIKRTTEGYHLTTRGEADLARKKLERYQFPTLTKWSGKWWVVCFDIPEKRKYIRHLLQRKLVEIGFYRLQDSVFVIPQPCGEFLQLAQEALFLRKELRGMVVDKMDDESLLLRHYGLSR